jgi:uncharacterized protein
MKSADDVIRALGLKPHPEGGHFRETHRDARPDGRAASTAIYYLLARGERSHWHKVDAAEVWHYYAGSALLLETAASGHGPIERVTLGPDIAAGERPQAVVPAHAWQAAESLGDWTLVGCTVAPGFEFEGFELAPKGWSPGAGGQSSG